jgi:hypothetical protein
MDDDTAPYEWMLNLLVSTLFYRCGRKKITVTSAKMHCHVSKKLTLLRWIDLVQHYWGTFFCLLDWFSLYLVEENGVTLFNYLKNSGRLRISLYSHSYYTAPWNYFCLTNAPPFLQLGTPITTKIAIFSQEYKIRIRLN